MTQAVYSVDIDSSSKGKPQKKMLVVIPLRPPPSSLVIILFSDFFFGSFKYLFLMIRPLHTLGDLTPKKITTQSYTGYLGKAFSDLCMAPCDII